MKKVLIIALSMAVASAHAFTSRQIETVTAIAVVPDIVQAVPFSIRHKTLQGISPVTKETIIQGESGANPKATDFPSRMKPFGIANTDVIRVTLRYRTRDLTGTTSDIITMPPIEGADPISFAFEIPPVDVPEFGTLEYQLISERLKEPDYVAVATVTVPANALTDPDAWVSVGLAAQAAFVVSAQGGRILLADGNPNDGESFVDFPANLFLLPIRVTFTELPLSSPFAPQAATIGQPVAIYQFAADQSFKGSLRASFLYPDFEYPIGQDGILDGTAMPESAATVVWWDGTSWRPISGVRDPVANTITVRFTDNMTLFAIVPAAGFSPDDRRPREKVITPNGDGNNDNLVFDLPEDTKVEIFDITGRRVRSVSGIGTVPWDGRDDSGDVVESGVYIYQYTDSGTRISGAVAVAK